MKQSILVHRRLLLHVHSAESWSVMEWLRVNQMLKYLMLLKSYLEA
jgi:hypothetical protein